MREQKHAIKRKIIGSLLCILLGTTLATGAWSKSAHASSVSELKTKQEEAQKEADSLSEAQEILQNSLEGLNSELWNASADLTEVENEIAQNQRDIENTQELLGLAQSTAQEQYANMKKRIQYIYENGNQNVMEMILKADSFGEFLNEVEYARAINTYDRRMMDSYLENLRLIEKTTVELAQKQQQLEEKRTELASKQEELNHQVVAVKNNLDSTANELSEKQAEISEFEEKIKAMEEYERKLKEEQARRDAERLAAIKAQEEELAGQGGDQVPVVPVDGDEYLLATLIYCEAGNQPYEGKLAVGSVVINRVRSGHFPNSIQGVIYQGGQFSPAQSGKLALAMEAGLANQECYQAAQAVLSGATTVDSLYFCVNNGLINGLVIGDHVFY